MLSQCPRSGKGYRWLDGGYWRTLSASNSNLLISDSIPELNKNKKSSSTLV